jgi:hypothetical protein
MIHPGMSGAIVVGEADGAGSAVVAVADPSDASRDPAAEGTSTPVIAAGAGIGGLAIGFALAALLRRRNGMLES